MAEGWVNTAVVLVFAVLIGIMLQLVGVLTVRMPESLLVRNGERFLDYLRRHDDAEYRAEYQRWIKAMPKSGWLALTTFYGLVGMLIGVVVLSPIRMNWWAFLPSSLLAFAVTEWLFSRAEAGNLSLRRHHPHPGSSLKG